MDYYFNIKPSCVSDHPVRTFRVKASTWDSAVDMARNEAAGLWRTHPSHVFIVSGGLIEDPIDTRPLIELTKAPGSDRLHIGVTEFDERGFGVRTYVLSRQDKHTADSVMQRRFDDMLRLMGDNVQTKH